MTPEDLKKLDAACDLTDAFVKSNLVMEVNVASVIIEAARAYAALPKMQKVDLAFVSDMCHCEGDNAPCTACSFDEGYNQAIDDIKSKYGELYAEVK